MKTIRIPDLSVVMMLGPSGSGKSTFTQTHFLSSQILSSDFYRKVVSDSETNQSVSSDAFEILHLVLEKRLRLGKLSVIDATNLSKFERLNVFSIAKKWDVPIIVIALNVSSGTCKERKPFNSQVIERQSRTMKQALRDIEKERYLKVYTLTEDDVNEVVVSFDKSEFVLDNQVPFDVIGDVHGCSLELCELLNRLGYENENGVYRHNSCRTAVFLGDLCDRGPNSAEVFDIVMNMVENNSAICILGSHEYKLRKIYEGRQIQVKDEIVNTVASIENKGNDFKEKVISFLKKLKHHYVLDGGKLVVSHAGLKEPMHGRDSGKVLAYCLYGETDQSKIDGEGYPERLDWTKNYKGVATVVYGHTPFKSTYITRNTYGIDQGCVYGGKLTALRWPEKELIHVEAKQKYYDGVLRNSFENREDDQVIDIKDVINDQITNTKLLSCISVNLENSYAALETMSRFTVDPNWLIYLPPTMSPCEAHSGEGEDYFLEHPLEAFEYYKKQGHTMVICEEKHMGSRAVIIVCRDEKTAYERFHVKDGSFGVIYTRTGRLFFENEKLSDEILKSLQLSLTQNEFWERYDTNWVALDTEIMPWSAKAQNLIKHQYSSVGAAGENSLNKVLKVIDQSMFMLGDASINSKVNLHELRMRVNERVGCIESYKKAYRKFCWDVEKIEDHKIAPFQILATEKGTWCDIPHARHLEIIFSFICKCNNIFIPTRYLMVNLMDEKSVTSAIDYWKEYTSQKNLGEGMVVKPLYPVSYKIESDKATNCIIQPAIKCRGREYLRLIYGPEYTFPDNMKKLQKRRIYRKQQLALNEFALGMEALERFIQKEPLWRIHQPVFNVLALESEPIDPRF